MSGIIRVTPEQLQTLGTRVSHGSQHIDAELRSLHQALAPLGSDWAGSAQARFQALWSEWNTAAANLREALSGISSLMHQAGHAYADAERAIAHSFARM